MAVPGFEPGAAGYEARMLLLCYATPPPIIYIIEVSEHRKNDFGTSAGEGELKIFMVKWHLIAHQICPKKVPNLELEVCQYKSPEIML